MKQIEVRGNEKLESVNANFKKNSGELSERQLTSQGICDHER